MITKYNAWTFIGSWIEKANKQKINRYKIYKFEKQI